MFTVLLNIHPRTEAVLYLIMTNICLKVATLRVKEAEYINSVFYSIPFLINIEVNYPSIHPSSTPCSVGSWGQQFQQDTPNFLFLRHFHNL